MRYGLLIDQDWMIMKGVIWIIDSEVWITDIPRLDDYERCDVDY